MNYKQSSSKNFNVQEFMRRFLRSFHLMPFVLLTLSIGLILDIIGIAGEYAAAQSLATLQRPIRAYLPIYHYATIHSLQMKPLEIFKRYIQGDLDNREQIEAERKAGKQIHPYAKHINRLADDKIINKPSHYEGFYILEESYYVYPENPLDTIVKPYLFWFTDDDGAVKLHSIQIPKRFSVQEIRNDNAALRFDYHELKLSPTFTPSAYTYNPETQSFSIKAVNPFPGGSFTLEETITHDYFSVMELLIKDGKQITPYSMPIIYKRF